MTDLILVGGILATLLVAFIVGMAFLVMNIADDDQTMFAYLALFTLVMGSGTAFFIYFATYLAIILKAAS